MYRISNMLFTIISCSFICIFFLFFFFFNDPATTEIYTLSLHDALPILSLRCRLPRSRSTCRTASSRMRGSRSEEHTSELQSRRDLVCRLLLEKKKKIYNTEIATIHNTILFSVRRHLSDFYKMLCVLRL